MRKKSKIITAVQVTLAMIVTLLPANTLNLHAAAARASMEQIKVSLAIPYKDEIRGNITLPKEKDGAEITWKSSRPEVITDEDIYLDDIDDENYDVMPAGVVTRQAEDEKVTLTATIRLDGVTDTKIFDVTVKAKPEEENLEAYFFAFFPGSPEALYFAAGKDPLHFKDLNNAQPVFTSTIGTGGIRDPYIFRSAEGDKYYIIATDLTATNKEEWDIGQYAGSLKILVWESTDMANWSEPRLVDVGMAEYKEEMDLPIGCVWAPEAIYDELTGEYVVFWASMTGPRNRAYQMIYYSRTRDFVTFTKAEKYIDRGLDREIYGDIFGATPHCIDTSMVKVKEDSGETKYYRVSADTAMSIEVADRVLGDWTKISDLTTLHTKMNGYEAYRNNKGPALTGGVVEGPELFQWNHENKWGVYSDNFNGVGYIPVTTTDISDTTGTAWQLYTKDQYHYGTLAKRHGSIIGVTKAEYINLMERWGGMETVTVTYLAGSGGTIQGKPVQKLEKYTDTTDTSGEMKTTETTEVTAKADDGYRFLSWSDGIKSETRNEINLRKDLTVSAVFEKDEKAFDAVNKIKAIGEVVYTEECKLRIDAAKAAYDSLNAEQKKLIYDTTYMTLKKAETAYVQLKKEADLKKDADDRAKAQEVINKISRIGQVTLNSKAVIEDAERAYAILTPVQKSLVTNYNVLIKARADYNKLVQQDELPAAGSKHNVGKFQYQIIHSAKKTVRLIKPKNKNLTTVTVPDTVTIKNNKYSVTEIANNAFKGNKKLKTVKIGTNITAIGNKAFNQAGKLKTVIIRTDKLNKIGKKAWTGISKKVTIKVPAKQLDRYKDLLKKKNGGLPKSASIKKQS